MFCFSAFFRVLCFFRVFRFSSSFFVVLRDDSLRWTHLVPNFHAMNRGIWELDCVIRSQLSISPQNRLSLRGIMGHTTQIEYSLSIKPPTDPFVPPFFDFSLAAHQPQCRYLHLSPHCICYTVFCLSILKDFLLSDCHICKAFFNQSVSALLKWKRMMVPRMRPVVMFAFH